MKFVVQPYKNNLWCVLLKEEYFSRILDKLYIKNFLKLSTDEEYYKLLCLYELHDDEYCFCLREEYAERFIENILNPVVVEKILIGR